MITGFNTDVRCGDKVFHVQTEDKGTQKPVIISLIYQKGRILDSYRTPYDSFQKSPRFNEVLLRQILECQHRQLVLAIKNGMYQKGMKLQPFQEANFTFDFPVPPEAAPNEVNKAPMENIPPSSDSFMEQNAFLQPAESIPALEMEKSPPPISSPKRQPKNLSVPREAAIGRELLPPSPGEFPPQEEPSPKNQDDSKDSIEGIMGMFNQEPVIPSVPKSQTPPAAVPNVQVLEINAAIRMGKVQGVEICLESSREFVAGSPIDLHFYIQSRSSQFRLENVPVIIKIIGTNFLPRIYSGKTDRNGSLQISFTLPEYQLGSAALLIQASTSAGSDQVKYLIKKK